MIAMYEDHGGRAARPPHPRSDQDQNQDVDLTSQDSEELDHGAIVGAESGAQGVHSSRLERPGDESRNDAAAGKQGANRLHPVPTSIAGLLSSVCAEIEKDLLARGEISARLITRAVDRELRGPFDV